MYTDIDYRVHYSWGGIKLNQAGKLIQFTLDEPEYMIEDSKAVSKRTMQSWNSQRYIWGGPIPVGFAFKRPYEGGHGTQSQHYAGVAFDVGQTLSANRRRALWKE